ncbi:WD40 repeat domain-containing protein [Candidatus Dependentiae bacterium]
MKKSIILSVFFITFSLFLLMLAKENGKKETTSDIIKREARAVAKSLTSKPSFFKEPHVASGGKDKKINIWNIKTLKQERTLEDTGVVRSVAFNFDNSKIASAGDDKKVKIWNLKNKKERQKPIATLDGHTDGHTEKINSVAFDHNILASGSSDKTVKLWDMQDIKKIKLIKTLTGHTGPVTSVTISDGKLLASGSEDKTINIWDIKDAKKDKPIKTLSGHNDTINSVAFNDDGTLLASGSSDETVKLWDMQDIKKIKLIKTLTEHTDKINCVTFSEDGTLLASGSSDKTIIIWTKEKKDWKQKTTIKCKDIIYAIAFSPDNTQIFSGVEHDGENKVHIWDIKTGKKTTKGFEGKGHNGTIYAIAISK